MFGANTEIARELGLYGAGQDILSDAFSGNLRGLGPGYAEATFTVRPSEPVLCFLADKTEPGAWNLPLYRIFADPFSTAGLIIDPKMHDGFEFEVHDLMEHKGIRFDCPAELYDLLLFIGSPSRYVIKSVRSKALGEVAAVTSTQRLSLMAGRYVGKDDPVMIVRCQSGLPAVGEALEPFAFPHAVAGCMRGSHNAPLMPVSHDDAHPSPFDGPPRVVCLGYQLQEDRLVGRRDMFADPSFDLARQQANEVMDYLRRHGPFEPPRLPLDEMEYTTMPAVGERLADRWEGLAEPAEPSRFSPAHPEFRALDGDRDTPPAGVAVAAAMSAPSAALATELTANGSHPTRPPPTIATRLRRPAPSPSRTGREHRAGTDRVADSTSYRSRRLGAPSLLENGARLTAPARSSSIDAAAGRGVNGRDVTIAANLSRDRVHNRQRPCAVNRHLPELDYRGHSALQPAGRRVPAAWLQALVAGVLGSG